MHQQTVQQTSNFQDQQTFETKSKFRTKPMKVLIETYTYSGSAFGVNEHGDLVFFSKRLVKAVSLDEGDVVLANCIPNYADQRDGVPWRCIHCKIVNFDYGK